jgi:hypothetical protein
MIDNAGLVIRPFVALLFLFGGVLLLRASSARLGAACITAGAVLFLGAELYGVFTLRPYIGRFFDEEWRRQIGTVDWSRPSGCCFARPAWSCTHSAIPSSFAPRHRRPPGASHETNRHFRVDINRLRACARSLGR